LNLDGWEQLPTTALIAAGNTLEGLAAAYLVNRFAGGRHVFDRPRTILMFLVLMVMLAAVSAPVGVTNVILHGLESPDNAFGKWLTWWVGDFTSDILVTPALVLWALNPRPRWSAAQVREMI